MENGSGVRFFAIQVDNYVQLHGIIHDATDFFSLETLLTPPKPISFKNLKRTSWLGLRNLIQLLKKMNCFHLNEIPTDIFDELIIMPEVSESFKFESFECLELDENSAEWSPNKVMKNFETINAEVSKKGYFPTLSLYFNQPQLQIFKPFVIGSKEHFYLSYFSFCSSVLSMLVRQQESLFLAFQGVSLRLEMRIRHLRTIAETISCSLPPPLSREDKKVVLEYVEEVTRVLRRLVEVLRLANFQYLASLSRDKLDPLREQSFKKYLQCLGKIAQIKPIMEMCGYKLGRLIQDSDFLKELTHGMAAFASSSFTSAQAASIKETLDTMDPLIGDSWDEAKSLVREEILAFQSDVKDAVLLVQGFDLARLVIEHRESELALPWSQSALLSSGDWKKAAKELLQQVSKKLVTDQETLAYQYYLSYYAKDWSVGNRDLQAIPGDLLLF